MGGGMPLLLLPQTNPHASKGLTSFFISLRCYLGQKMKNSYILERNIMKEDNILRELEAEQAEYEAVEYVAVEKPEEEIANFKATVLANVKQKKAINIRALESDIIKIKSKALSKGIPYQTLINSVIHQFANDKLLEAK